MSYNLVTGGAGFIGSHLVEELLNLNKKVVIVDNLSMGKEENIPNNDNLTFIKGDISDSDFVNDIFKKYEFEKIFHLGAIASVAASVETPLETHRTNLEATLYLLEEAKKQGILNRFVFASSAAVFGDEPTLPKTENSEIRPLSPYAIDKYASEQYVLTYNKLYDLPTTAVRFFNVFGARQNPSSPYSGVVSILTEKFLKLETENRVEFTLYGDGEQTRDFVYVKDIVNALILVSENPQAVGEVFNAGTGNSVSLNELIALYEELTGLKLTIKREDERAGDIKYSYSDITKIEGIGYKPFYNMKTGLLEYWNEEKKYNG
ncbi:NAD-dependent epimerase/dehydratase family protein [Rossellomorea sp. NRS-1567]|uniref:NAD-dependent epimerase/dehydratase family protein n=1 Tax=Rossellomorea sp. NRS-1567 TaxID=3233901 RepID=UPI003D29BF1F